MARITVEDALEKVTTRYELIILAAKRARQLATGGRRPTLEWEDDKPTVMALREIEAGTVTTDNINELKDFFNSKISKHCFGVDINSHFEIDYANKDFQLIKNFKNEL